MNDTTRSNRRNGALTLRPAHRSPWELRRGSNENAFKRLGLEQSASNQGFLERLEAENAQLRCSVVELVLQIQALRDGAR
jgi:hypothetical protein